MGQKVVGKDSWADDLSHFIGVMVVGTIVAFGLIFIVLVSNGQGEVILKMFGMD